MKAKELIQILQTLDPEVHVLVEGYEGGYNFASFTGEGVEEFVTDFYSEWYYGSHEKVGRLTENDMKDRKIIKGIVL
jgi:hypothetical protein